MSKHVLLHSNLCHFDAEAPSLCIERPGGKEYVSSVVSASSMIILNPVHTVYFLQSNLSTRNHNGSVFFPCLYTFKRPGFFKLYFWHWNECHTSSLEEEKEWKGSSTTAALCTPRVRQHRWVDGVEGVRLSLAALTEGAIMCSTGSGIVRRKQTDKFLNQHPLFCNVLFLLQPVLALLRRLDSRMISRFWTNCAPVSWASTGVTQGPSGLLISLLGSRRFQERGLEEDLEGEEERRQYGGCAVLAKG